jgi:demethylmenaquinone methyltransferase / 2-methoxy-6-polyprenyl-1,4-benzoquinol methylase
VPADPLEIGPDRQRAVREMFDRIAPQYGRLNSLMTFGLDRRWRTRTVAALALTKGSLVIDVGCGPGELCSELERGGYRAIGFDLSEGMLRAAVGNPVRVQADGLRLPLADGVADGVTCGFALRNVADQTALFAEIARVLRDGGRLALLEVAEPEWEPAHAVHRIYFRRLVPWLGAVLSDHQAYSYLPASTALLPSPSALRTMAESAGLGEWNREMLSFGAAQLVTATRCQPVPVDQEQLSV